MIKLKKMKINKLVEFTKRHKNTQCSDFYEKLNFKNNKRKFSFDLNKSKISLKKTMEIKYE